MENDSIPFAEKIKTINFGNPAKRGPKVTTDVHDNHSVQVTESWNDRVDVTVKPGTIRLDKDSAHG